MDKVTGQCPQTTTFFEEKGEPKRYQTTHTHTDVVSNRGPSAYQPDALPLGQTGSHRQVAAVLTEEFLCLHVRLDEALSPI